MPAQTTSIEGLTYHKATPEDIPLLLSLIQALAEYEKRPEDATLTAADLNQWLFENPAAEALVAHWEGKPAGYAIYYPVLSSFKGKPALYLEDLFILPELRGKGFGKELLRQLGCISIEKGWQGMQWSCLDWNRPAIDFYRKLGAKAKTGTVGFGMDADMVQQLVEK